MSGWLNIAQRLLLSRLALFWEHTWPALWPIARIVYLFLVLALLDLFPVLPGWLHAAAIIGFSISLIWALWRGVISLRLPSRTEGQHRLEQVNGLLHRPFEAIEDAIAAPRSSSQTLYLWQLNRERAARRLKSLRIGWPRPGLIRSDRFATRVVLVPLLAVAAIVAGDDSKERLGRAITPSLAIEDTTNITLDAWITPPSYTKRPPIFLSRNEAETAQRLEVPVNSVFVAQVSGGQAPPSLTEGENSNDFTRITEDSFRIEHTLKVDTHLGIFAIGSELARWQFVIIPDKSPHVALDKAPSPTKRGSLRVIYSASDDYGLASITTVIRRSDALSNKSITYDIPLGANLKKVRSDSFRDLTPHPWAGLLVNLTLEATDVAGNQSESDTHSLRLPERNFAKPVAQEIVAARKALMANPELNRLDVVDDLGRITWKPSRYNDDKAVFMALHAAVQRLRKKTYEADLDDVQNLLWETALRVEDGAVSLAGREFRRAHQKLLKALARHVPESEIKRLTDQLQAALSDYLDALQMQMANFPQANSYIGKTDPNKMMITRQDLLKMMKEIRELAKAGAREAARRMLSQMQHFMENLQTTRNLKQRFSSQTQQMMYDLQRVMKGQRTLLDRTFRQAQRDKRTHERKSPSSPKQDTKPQQHQKSSSQQNLSEIEKPANLRSGAIAQDALGNQLGGIMRRFAEMTGGIPTPMVRAKQSMRKSSKNLRKGSAQTAVPPQIRAVDQLQQAMRSVQQQLQQRYGQQPSHKRVRGPSQLPDNRDPFGRSMNSRIQDVNPNAVDIPEKRDLQRTRTIRNELRRRAADQSRPHRERDYIGRLLNRF